MPAVFLGLGLASLALVIATNRIHVRLIDDDQSRINALQRVENSLTMAHLRLEEYVAGDDLNLTRSADRLERASALIADILGQDRDALSVDDAPPMTSEWRAAVAVVTNPPMLWPTSTGGLAKPACSITAVTSRHQVSSR